MTIIKKMLFYSLFLVIASCKGQGEKTTSANNAVNDTTKQFVITNYMIVPDLQEIRAYRMIGGVDWEGFVYRKDPKIDYKNTILLALGDRIIFKEYFDFDFNLDELKIIHKDKFYFLCKDNKNIYYTSSGIKPTKIDISDYEMINDFIYKSKNGQLFFLDIEEYKLTAIEINIDENSIKHIAKNYYYDKNGLYIFGEHSKQNAEGYYDNYIDKSEKLIDALNIEPIISKKHFCFNNQVFALDENKIKKLHIDAKKIIEIDYNAGGSFITDGNAIYNSSNYGYDEKNGNGYYGIWYPVLYSGIDIQKIYSPFLNYKKENNSIVFNKKSYSDFMGLVATFNNQNYLLTDKKKFKMDSMLFYRPETRTTEIFDEKYLKIYTNEQFIQYKNMLYFDGIPVKSDKLEMENLREIDNSNYLTDGKTIFYIGNITGYGSPTIKGVEYATFDDRILENAFTKEMKVLNADLLSDKITLISKNQKIVIKDLHLNVKIIE